MYGLTQTLEGVFHVSGKSLVTHLTAAELGRGCWLEVVGKQTFWTEQSTLV